MIVLGFAFFVGTVAAFGISCYLFIAAVARDIDDNLQLINESSRKSRKNRLQSMEYLFDFIKIHSSTKKLR